MYIYTNTIKFRHSTNMDSLYINYQPLYPVYWGVKLSAPITMAEGSEIFHLSKILVRCDWIHNSGEEYSVKQLQTFEQNLL